MTICEIVVVKLACHIIFEIDHLKWSKWAKNLNPNCSHDVRNCTENCNYLLTLKWNITLNLSFCDEHTEHKKVIRGHRFEKMLLNSKFTLELQSNCNSGVDVPRAFLKFEYGVDVLWAYFFKKKSVWPKIKIFWCETSSDKKTKINRLYLDKKKY